MTRIEELAYEIWGFVEEEDDLIDQFAWEFPEESRDERAKKALAALEQIEKGIRHGA